MEEYTNSENARKFWSTDMMLIYPPEPENALFCNKMGNTMGIWMYIMMKILSKKAQLSITEQ